MKQIANGDEKALRLVMDSLLDKVTCLAYRILYSKDDAEDVAQEVFMKLYKSAPQWKAKASLDTWVYQVTLNTSLTIKQKRKTINVDDITKTSPAFNQSKSIYPDLPEENTEKKIIENNKIIERALKLLNERNRIALTLFYFDGLKIKEAAKIMEISEDAYESLLRRSRVKLKTLFFKKNVTQDIKNLFPESTFIISNYRRKISY